MNYQITGFGHIPNINLIRDPMQLDSGQAVAWMEGKNEKVKVTIEDRICGEVRVIFRDVVYKAASQMPSELLDAYGNGTDKEDLASSDGRRYDCPYLCDNNNWLEEFVTVADLDGKVLSETSQVVDIPCDNSPESWKRCLSDALSDAVFDYNR